MKSTSEVFTKDSLKRQQIFLAYKKSMQWCESITFTKQYNQKVIIKLGNKTLIL